MADIFVAQIRGWSERALRNLDLIVAQSTAEVIAIAQEPKGRGGRMPIDTGFLRNSLQSTLMGNTQLSGPASYIMIAGNMKAGDVAEFGWTAEYARHVEYGAQGRRPAHFAKGAAMAWSSIVEANARRLA